MLAYLRNCKKASVAGRSEGENRKCILKAFNGKDLNVLKCCYEKTENSVSFLVGPSKLLLD